MGWASVVAAAPGRTRAGGGALDSIVAAGALKSSSLTEISAFAGGGCLFCYGPPDARPAIAAALVDGGARVLEYRIEMEGLRVG